MVTGPADWPRPSVTEAWHDPAAIALTVNAAFEDAPPDAVLDVVGKEATLPHPDGVMVMVPE
jgi:hypothetical protein